LNLKKVIEFCEDEVERQGFRRYSIDWARRVYYMLAGWGFAWSVQHRNPTLYDIKLLGHLVEPDANPTSDIRHAGVCVRRRDGSVHYFVPASDVERMLEELLQDWERGVISDPDVFYKAFEEIHPYNDGNGRVGKILHNWVRGSLGEPVLVEDFFGGGVP